MSKELEAKRPNFSLIEAKRKGKEKMNIKEENVIVKDIYGNVSNLWYPTLNWESFSMFLIKRKSFFSVLYCCKSESISVIFSQFESFNRYLGNF